MQQRFAMLMELTIIPFGEGRSLSGEIADLVGIIEHSGLDYRMTAFGTLVEGNWDQLIALARECHFKAKGRTDRVLTTIRLDDFGERTGEIDGAVSRVEASLGEPSGSSVRNLIAKCVPTVKSVCGFAEYIRQLVRRANQRRFQTGHRFVYRVTAFHIDHPFTGLREHR
jgi:uncharacterized protein (TIGR00106 family)